MSDSPGLSVDVVIPFRGWDAWTADCVRAALEMDPPCRHVSLVPDAALGPETWASIRRMPGAERVREWPSGPVNPGRKRNLAMDRSEDDVFGFVDSDARVWPDWLARALPHFEDPAAAIVGGPNLTPPEDDARQQACGDVMASPMGMGAAYIRHVAVSRREVDELPTCNLLVRNRPGFRFRPELDTSEDMTFCALARERGGRIVYDPQVGVWHHRRRLGRAFWRQFHDYGVYQGRRASWRWLWRAAPFALLLYGLVWPVAWALAPRWWPVWCAPPALYAAAVATESLRQSRARRGWLWTLLAFPVAHAAYGTGYARGLLNGGSDPR